MPSLLRSAESAVPVIRSLCSLMFGHARHVPTPAPTVRTTLRRLPARGDHERSTIAAILDEALICHVALVDPEGRPFVIQTIHARVDDTVYLHGSPANRALRTAAADGVECCVTATIVDGLVLARSTFHHSMNYRSVVIYGTATKVEDPAEKTAALEALVEHVLAGRGVDARQPNETELRGTPISCTRPSTNQWSPAPSTRSMEQSIQATTPSRTGDPVTPARHPTDWYLSPPRLAKARQTSSWSAARTLTQKAPDTSIFGHDDEPLSGRKPTSERSGCAFTPWA